MNTLAIDRNLTFIEPHTAEYEFAWAQLRKQTAGDNAQLNRGECWHYMGTEFSRHGWQHTFRHRCHPSDQERHYMRFPVSPDWEPPHSKKHSTPARPIDDSEDFYFGNSL